MEYLLDNIPPLIAKFLPPSCALNFSQTCKKLHSQLSLSVTLPLKILSKFSRDKMCNERHHGFRIPVISQSQAVVHTMVVSMRWRDQGWGNRKGRVYIIAEEENETTLDIDRPSVVSGEDFGDHRRIVFASPGKAPHRTEQLKIRFKPRQNESYHLWYVVGGGGGHSLSLSDIRIESLVFDDPSRSFGKAYNFLVSNHLGSSQASRGFHFDTLRTILASATHSLTHGLQVLPPILLFFEKYGISEADMSPNLIESIESLWSGLENDVWDGEEDDHSDSSGGEEDYDFWGGEEDDHSYSSGSEEDDGSIENVMGEFANFEEGDDVRYDEEFGFDDFAGYVLENCGENNVHQHEDEDED